jgi:hypothetical protein
MSTFLLVVRGRIDWFSLISTPFSQKNFKKKEVSMSKFTVDIVDNEYSSNAKTVTCNTLQVPRGLIVRNNSSSVEIGIVGIKGTVMVYKDNPRQSMDLPKSHHKFPGRLVALNQSRRQPCLQKH